MEKLNLDEILSMEFKEAETFSRPIVVYGAGGYAAEALKVFNEHNIFPIAVCDSDPNRIGDKFFGFTIMSFEQVLADFADFDIFIASAKCYDEIRKYILKFIPANRVSSINFFEREHAAEYREFVVHNKQNLINIYNKLADDTSREVMKNIIKGRLTNCSRSFEAAYSPNQYFNKIIQLSDEECFIDGGAYTGDTLKKFIMLVNNRYKKIYSFEPSLTTFKALKSMKAEAFSNDERIILFNKGLYNCNQTISFNSKIGNGGDKIVAEADCDDKIEVVTIDSVIDDKVTFIKLDIEGSELQALKGAKNTILKYRPKLAVCVYHKTDDLVKIPEFLINLGLDYKCYLRHHGISPGIINETVIYAV